MSTLAEYWPSIEEINHCIKPLADADAIEVLLAVHQPMPLVKRTAGGSSSNDIPVSEHDLLEAFLTPNLPEGMLLLPVTGDSGAGKSHLIKWIAAQLERDPRAAKMHVILVPKSANLRTVVELILEPLQDDPRYTSAMAELENAVASVKLEDAVVRFIAELTIALRDVAENITRQMTSDVDARSDRDLRAYLDHARRLPDFFTEPAVRAHFETEVLKPIIERAVRGRTNNVQAGSDDEVPQFSPDDLRIPPEIDLGSASHAVTRYHQTTLNSAGGRGREVAAKVLNDVTDQAVKRVFRLDQSIGGITFEDIVLRVRELLFEEGRELVLLVEDFAVLSGIKETLFNVCVQDAVHAGEQVRSFMRTALAVTDGDLSGRDTVLTRAGHEWVIRSEMSSDDATIDRCVNLIGGYLNAARWGRDELRHMFAATKVETESDLTGWIRTFESESRSPEDADRISAFGVSSRGESLFPLNRCVIEKFAARVLSDGDQLRFNPRLVLNLILRRLLLQRDLFTNGNFPPARIEGANPAASVAAWLSQLQIAEDIRERLRGFLFYWGGDPQSIDDVAAVRPGLFEAFKLPTPEQLGQSPRIQTPAPKPIDVPKPGDEKPISTSSVQQDHAVKEWEDKLEQWSGGVKLNQQDARRLRNIVTQAVEKHIDWNSECMRPRQLKFLMTIPNAAGNEAPAKYRLEISDDHTDQSGILRQTFMAAIRYEQAGSNWDYDGGEEDSALFANLVEDLTARLVPLLSQERNNEIGPLIYLLIRQGRILGICPRRTKSQVELVRVVTADSPKVETSQLDLDSPGGRWAELQVEVKELRADVQRELFDRIACFQGTTGKKRFAIDATKFRWDVSADQEKLADFLPQNLKAHAVKLRDIRLSVRTRPLIKYLKGFSKYVGATLGVDFDKKEFIDKFGQLVDEVEQSAVWPSGDFGKSRMKSDIEAFRNTPIKELLSLIEPLCGDDVDPVSDSTLDVLGRLDLSVVTASQDVLLRMESFLGAVEQRVEIDEKGSEGIDPQADIKVIDRLLSDLALGIQQLTTEKAVK